MTEDCANELFAAELANKLCEEKDELMRRFGASVWAIQRPNLFIFSSTNCNNSRKGNSGKAFQRNTEN